MAGQDATSPSAPVIAGHPSTSSLGKAIRCLGEKPKKRHILSREQSAAVSIPCDSHQCPPKRQQDSVLFRSCYEAAHIIKPAV